ncbi:MAG: hypothetical protein FJX25_05215 [Alphaproteobacteria bacterium]|nr:hypothetical protein [Alphaproteobacteria bacterium]
MRAEEAFSFADYLVEANIPFVLATGYEKHELPPRLAGIPHLVKPCSSAACIDAALALAASRSPDSAHHCATSQKFMCNKLLTKWLARQQYRISDGSAHHDR